MNQNQLLQEAMKVFADPKAMAAIQTATAPLLASIQQKRDSIKQGGDPLSSLFDMLSGVTNPTEQPKQEEPQPEVKQDPVALALSTLSGKNGQLFVHNVKATPYLFLNVTNEKSTDQVKFPTTANYFDLINSTVWSRPVVDFVQKFTAV